jgi:hypothetical protein
MESLVSNEEIIGEVALFPQKPSKEVFESNDTHICIFCEQKQHDSSKILEHLLKEHNFVIGDVERIADLAR